MRIPLHENHPLEAIGERDIDLLLIEEVLTDAMFATRLLQAVLPGTDAVLAGAWKSLCDDHGECDLLVAYDDAQGQRLALLIENKIDEDFQPDQPQRYVRRAAWGAAAGAWHIGLPVLVAPRAYPAGEDESACFVARIDYETLQDWIARGGGPRGAYRADILRQAIEQQRRGYTKTVNPASTAFWARYWQRLKAQRPHIHMDRPGPQGAVGDWPLLGRFPQGVRLLHKMTKGCIDLEFKRVTEDMLAAHFGPYLDGTAIIVTTGKSASIRIAVASIHRMADFDPQVAALDAAWDAADRLIDLFNRVGAPKRAA